MSAERTQSVSSSSTSVIEVSRQINRVPGVTGDVSSREVTINYQPLFG